MAIYRNITRAEYEALPGINWSALKCGLGKTAAHITAAKAGRKDSSALRFGRAFHTYVLQPERWGEWEVKDAKTTTLPNAVTTAEMADIEAMALAVKNLHLGPITNAEMALTWTYGGVACKAMIDGLLPSMLGDLKSTKDASATGFGREIIRYVYHGQMAFYAEGLERNDFDMDDSILIAVEKTAPYAAAGHVLSGTYMDLGRKCMDDALEVWADGKGANYGVALLDPPDWAHDDDFIENDDGISLGGYK